MNEVQMRLNVQRKVINEKKVANGFRSLVNDKDLQLEYASLA